MLQDHQEMINDRGGRDNRGRDNRGRDNRGRDNRRDDRKPREDKNGRLIFLIIWLQENPSTFDGFFVYTMT